MQFFNLENGQEIDRSRIKADEFAESECLIVVGKPNGGCGIENVFTGQSRIIPINGSLYYVDGSSVLDYPHRIFSTQYVIARTWEDYGYGDVDRIYCYNIITGEQVLNTERMRLYCSDQFAISHELNMLCIEECGLIRTYDLAKGKLIYEIQRAAPMNLGYRVKRTLIGENKVYFNDYKKEVRNPQNISALSLHPKFFQLVAIAVGSEITLLDTSHNLRDVFRTWSSGKVIDSIKTKNGIGAICFTPSGEKIVQITLEDKLNVYDLKYKFE